METFNREDWIKNDCVYTGSERCDACPYVIYNEFGSRKCDKEMYETCSRRIKKELKEEA